MEKKIFIILILIVMIVLSFFIGYKEKSKEEQTNNELITNNEDNEYDNEKVETSLYSAKEDKSEEDNDKLEKETKANDESLNDKNKITIVIDPGHASKSNLEKEPLSPESNTMKIKDGGGASGVVTGTPEYKIAMRVAKSLNEKLLAEGYEVIMTKTDDYISLGNVERAEIGNKANADLVIRLHCDSFSNSSAKGASMLVPKGINENTKLIASTSEKYGKVLLDTYCSKMNIKNRGLIYSEDMTGFNWSRVPVVLIEMGFLSNPDEDNMMSSQSFPENSSEALKEGIKKILPIK